VTLTGDAGDVALEDVARAVTAGGIRLRGLGTRQPELEDVFVELTGEGFDVAG
jgi:ABC-2 type transport system ATP-binding protein